MDDLTAPQEKELVVEDLTADLPKSTAVSGPRLEAKTSKTAIAMPDKDIKEIEANLAGGNEEGLRRELAAKVDEKKTAAARELVVDMVEDNQGWSPELFAGVARLDSRGFSILELDILELE